MPGTQDKAQRPAEQAGKCQHCSGTGTTKKANGAKVACMHCRGTGSAARGYVTK